LRAPAAVAAAAIAGVAAAALAARGGVGAKSAFATAALSPPARGCGTLFAAGTVCGAAGGGRLAAAAGATVVAFVGAGALVAALAVAAWVPQTCRRRSWAERGPRASPHSHCWAQRMPVAAAFRPGCGLAKRDRTSMGGESFAFVVGAGFWGA
jgi:hypothetical protein